MSALNEKKKLAAPMPDFNTIQPADKASMKVCSCLDSMDEKEFEWAKDQAYRKILSKIAEKMYDRHSLKDKKTIKIKAREFLSDIRSGMSDLDLMDKHNLNERQLQSAFRKMIKSGKVSTMEVANRLYITESQTFTALIEADQLQCQKFTKKRKKDEDEQRSTEGE
jgi:hypothetical protein